MMEKRILAIISAIGAAVTASGTSLVATGQTDVDWTSPAGIGGAHITFGVGIGAGVGAFKGMMYQRTEVIGATRKRV